MSLVRKAGSNWRSKEVFDFIGESTSIIIVAKTFDDADKYAERVLIKEYTFLSYYYQLHDFKDKNPKIIILGKRSYQRDDYERILNLIYSYRFDFKIFTNT